MPNRTLQIAVDDLLAVLPHDEPVACVRDGPRLVIGVGASEEVALHGHDALRWLDDVREGWWAGYCAYDLGRAVERIPDLARPLPLPDLAFVRFGSRLVREDGAWRVEGDRGPADELLLRAARAPAPPRAASLGPWTSSLDRSAFEGAVAEILEHIRSGECFQVNLTRRLEASSSPDPVDLFRRLRTGNPAPHEALVRLGGTAVVSASPERFLRRDGAHVETRPIKGTHRDPAVLAHSAKDRAENVMIVDLSRNDLGRVCDYGSVHVPELCALEEHPGLWHLVSTVRGRLRPGVGNGTLLRATLPPASVTGCPKPRVLEIIESLEPVRRGIYCGAVGFLDADREALDLNVAIRTFTISGGGTSFGVGGGIVADSDPGAEWEETELKASRLLALAGGP